MNLKEHKVLAVLVAVAGLCGCDELNQTANKSTKPARVVRENRVPVHRFVLTRYDGGVAFDTQTGQICRTWDWQPVGKSAKLDLQTGLAPQRSFGEFAPTCISVYQQYASGTNPQSEEIPDEQPSS
jgi:hypothetical protein